MNVRNRFAGTERSQQAINLLAARTLVVLVQRIPLYWLSITIFLMVIDLLASLVFIRQRWIDAFPEGIYVNIAVISAVLLGSITASFLRTTWRLRGVLVLALFPVLVLCVTSHNVAALAIFLVSIVPLSWLGRILASALIEELSRFEAWAIGGAFTIVLLGTIGFVLGTIHALFSIPIIVVLIILTVLTLVLAHEQLSSDLQALNTALQIPRQLQSSQIVLIGLTVGCIWLNIPGALAPEIRSDATRQRLVAAAHFARSGDFLPTDPDIPVENDTAFGEIAYAVPIALGSLQAAKLTHWFAGILCATILFALGKRLSGNWAGIIGAAAFYNTLLVAYESQTAYLDLLLALLAASASLCLIAGKGNSNGAVFSAGILLGVGVTIKVHFGYIALGLTITLVIIAQINGWKPALRQGVLLILAGAITALPWLIRSALLTQSLPIYGYFSTAFFNHDQLGDLPTFGYGRSPWQLLLAPFSVTFLSRQFGGMQLNAGPLMGGHIGFVLIALLPLAYKIRGSRHAMALMVGSAIGVLLWFYTAQHIRYLLPTLALLYAIAGMSYVSIFHRMRRGWQRAGLNSLLILLIIFSIAARTQLPSTAHRYALGLETYDQYLTQWLRPDGAGGYEAIQLLNADPSASHVLVVPDGARLYSEIPMTPATTQLLSSSSDSQILQQLIDSGYTHILIDRSAWWGANPIWDQVGALNEDFLRRHTVLVGGGDSSYLYRIVTRQGAYVEPWAQGEELLPPLQDWCNHGAPYAADTGAPNDCPNSRVLLQQDEIISAGVSISPNTNYLLSVKTISTETYDKAVLEIEWQNHQGDIIATTREYLPVSPKSSHILSLIGNAPDGAVKGTVRASVVRGKVWFSEFSLKSTSANTYR